MTSRSEDLTSKVIAAVILAIIIVVIFAGVFWISGVSCHSRWGASGEYRMIGGCFVNGVPEANVRVVQ